MGERNFAPAPWGWHTSGKPGGNGDFNAYVIDRDERKIAAVWGKRGEKEWTGAIIAATPDLYDYVSAAAMDGCKRAGKLIAEIDTMAHHAAQRQSPTPVVAATDNEGGER